MDRIGRFLWLPWAHGEMRVKRRSARGRLVYWEGQHDGYRRLPDPVSYRRAIVALGEEHWLVLDHLRSQGGHDYRLHWLLPDFLYEWQEAHGTLLLEMGNAQYRVQVGAIGPKPRMTLVRADPHSPRGWYAPHYYHRQPALSLAARLQDSTVTFWTLLGPNTVTVTAGNGAISLISESWRADVRLSAESATSIADAVYMEGNMTDKLELTR